MQKIKGTLIPIGGNEDKGIEADEMYSLEFIDEGILFHVVKEAGGSEAKIVVYQQHRVFLLKLVKIT